jgi:AcrR family transcriptional regulator
VGADGRDVVTSIAVGPSTKEQLVLTAERLFAEQGIDGVSLRQIAIESGNANNSAVQYHFGSKDNLIQAIFEYRVPQLARRRRLLAEQRPPHDMRSTVECYLLPTVEEAEHEDSYYVTFLSRLQSAGAGVHPFDRLPDALKAATFEFYRAMATMLPEVPETLLSTRVDRALAVCMHACSDRALARRHGSPVLPFALHVSDLFDGVIGYLAAPVSPATLAAITEMGTPLQPRFTVP